MTLEKAVEKAVEKKTQKLLLAVMSLGWGYVAAGVMILPFVQPIVMKEWNVSSGFSAALSSSGFLGMFIGALFAGIISDYIGRKKTSLFFMFIATLFTILTGISGSEFTFITFRIISGFGFGGLLPALNTYLTEFLSSSIRGKYLVLLESSWAFGSIYIALVHLIAGRKYGWRYDFYFMAIGIVIMFIIAFLPESPKYLIVKGKNEKFKKYFGFYPEKVEIPQTKKFTLLNILKKEYIVKTIMLWLLWFVMSFGYYGIFMWIKSILYSKGIDFVKTDWYTFYMYLAQLPGYYLAAHFVEKAGRRISVLIFMTGTGISSLLFAYASNNTAVLILSLVVSIFCMGAWGITYAYTPELYPTKFRGTANGSSSAVTRIAGFTAPFYTSYFLEKGSIFTGLIGISAMFIIVGILNYIFLPETRGTEVN
ncbi:MAG: MFS transporter [Thermotogae bacterium]|nr:MFS transporter [Thermotogota bacterium]MCP5465145.1 MFS transporter [Thermotogota bacterium]HOO75652.1 MFS transporter [Tepiditoga sp.]